MSAISTEETMRLITGSPYYACRDYFWVPRALQTFDLPDLASLVAPRRLAWIDPVDAMLEPLPSDRCQDLCGWPRAVYAGLGSPEKLEFSPAAGGTAARAVDRLLSFLRE